MKGFFPDIEFKNNRKKNKVYSCEACGLSKKRMEGRQGRFKKGILIVTDYPSEEEYKKKELLQDAKGYFFKEFLKSQGIIVERDCLVVSSLKCVPEIKANTKMFFQIDCCRRFLLQIIKEEMPKLIIPIGEFSLISVIGHRWKKDFGNIKKWRGWIIPDQDYKAWICPISLQTEDESNQIWKQDLLFALEYLNKPFEKWKKPVISYIEDLAVLNNIKSGQTVTIDFETTGIKPDAYGHRIICASVADSADHVYSFPIPDCKEKRKPFLKLLSDPTIYKMAQNIKFDHAWALVRLKTEIQGWYWDSMIASHILDNREGVTGLKFQAYVRFGIINYDEDVSLYLQGENSNAINKIHTLIQTVKGKQDLLTYCAMDSIIQYRLSFKQMELMDYTYLPF